MRWERRAGLQRAAPAGRRTGPAVRRAASGFEADTQKRFSLLYEYTPIQFLQLRGGGRVYDGDPLDPQQNRAFWLLELHGFF